MNKYRTLILFTIILLVGVVVWESSSAPSIITNDYKTAKYFIENKWITLGTEGTKYFGNEVFHDLDDDEREDVAFILTYEPGGSGTFFYAVAALNTPDGYIGSEVYLLGDRIAPMPTNIDEGMTSRGTYRKNVIVFNYADRLPEEPFTKRPSIGKSVWLKLDPATMRFAEVAQDFEGEAK